jgi:hypothetical protein
MDSIYTKDDIAFASDKEAITMIRHNILNNDRWLMRALLAIYKNQTTDEQNTQNTKYRNGLGFGAADAEILTSFSQQLTRNKTLSPKQLEIARKKVGKYCKQLLAAVRANEQQPA